MKFRHTEVSAPPAPEQSEVPPAPEANAEEVMKGLSVTHVSLHRDLKRRVKTP